MDGNKTGSSERGVGVQVATCTFHVDSTVEAGRTIKIDQQHQHPSDERG